MEGGAVKEVKARTCSHKVPILPMQPRQFLVEPALLRMQVERVPPRDPGRERSRKLGTPVKHEAVDPDAEEEARVEGGHEEQGFGEGRAQRQAAEVRLCKQAGQCQERQEGRRQVPEQDLLEVDGACYLVERHAEGRGHERRPERVGLRGIPQCIDIVERHHSRFALPTHRWPQSVHPLYSG